jgi:hypothetical protein
LELTFEAALSAESMLGHFGYVLLIISMLMREMVFLRIFFMASAVVSIAYAIFVLTDPVGVFWETLLILVNAGQLLLIWWTNRSAQFDDRETNFRNAHFPDLAPSYFKTLLSAGEWVSMPAGSRLSTQGQPVPALIFLFNGGAKVWVDEKDIGVCQPGSFVGEMTIASSEPASATVVLAKPAEVWRLEAQSLRGLAKRSPEISAALDAAFFRVLRSRIIDRNRMDAAAQFRDGAANSA